MKLASLRARWPQVRRRMATDGLLLLGVLLLARHVGVAWIHTDSVGVSVALVLKGAAVAPGQLAVLAYPGAQLAHFHGDTAWRRLAVWLGADPSPAGPRPGTGMAKYLVGVAGDRVEVVGREVYLHTRRGRLAMGRCKEASRHGEALHPIAGQVIPDGFVYVWAPHPDALDSRYALMGLVPVSHLRGRAVALV